MVRESVCWVKEFSGFDVRVFMVRGEKGVKFGRIVSPCVGICILDDKAGICKGCLRNMEEIESWSSMSEEERYEVLESLRERRRRLGRVGSRERRPGRRRQLRGLE